MTNTSKPDFHRTGAWAFGGGNLNETQAGDLWHLIPSKMKEASTMNRMGVTDAQRVLLSLDEALGRYDAYAACHPAPEAGAKMIQDVQAIGAAAQRLMVAIRSASSAARTAIDEEAFYYRTSSADDRLSVTGKLCVDWHGGLESIGLQSIADQVYIDGPREFSEHDKSLLSRLWDLADDACRMTKDAQSRITPGRNTRVDRVNAQQLARFFVSSFASNMGNPPPQTSWYFELVAAAGKFRSLTVGRDAMNSTIKAFKALPSTRGGSIAKSTASSRID